MTNANMKLVFALVPFADTLVKPKANLDEGEFIVTRVVELAKLKEILTGRVSSRVVILLTLIAFVVLKNMTAELVYSQLS
jgi:hypothetical protein